MKHISVLIKPASSLCNIRCSYCFYADISSLRDVKSYGRMTAATTEKMVTSIYHDLNDGDQLSLSFQGGEPTLAGLTYFKHLTTLINSQSKSITIHYAIQTNGMIINDQWCLFLKEHNFLVGLSIDGHPLYHDINRLDTRGRGTFQRVLQTKKMFDSYKIEYNVLCVLTETLAQQAKKVYQFMTAEKIEYIQFIPCLDELRPAKRNSYALTPSSFANFYQQLLSLWLADLKKGKKISVKLFDDLLNLLVTKQQTACGMLGNCGIQYIIEADGSVYPCDFYVLDEWRMGYIQEETLKQLFSKPLPQTFLCSRTTLPGFCQQCPFFTICQGGCKRMADAVYVDENRQFCGYQSFLKIFIPQN